jgi:hypothetical protein
MTETTIKLATRSVSFPAYVPKGIGIGDYYDGKSHDAHQLSLLLDKARAEGWDARDIKALEMKLEMARYVGD